MKEEIIAPLNYLEKITEVYVFASVDEGGEGIVGHTAYIGGREVFMPFVCADKARLESIKPMAKQIARDHNKKIKLIRLSVREEIEEYGK
jgi:hypothetical protein